MPISWWELERDMAQERDHYSHKVKVVGTNVGGWGVMFLIAPG